jgi:hypothetical protein
MNSTLHAERGGELRGGDRLGAPHGSISSLFVTQSTALAMKKVYWRW